jgi:hypothetical protein
MYLNPAPTETITTTAPTTTTTAAATMLNLGPISNVPWDQTVTVTGKLVDADNGDGISGQTITLTGTRIKEEQQQQQEQQEQQEQQQTLSAKTGSDGTFTATFTEPNTVANGWTAQAHYAGNDDSNLQSPDSEERTFATLKHATTLTLALDPAQAANGGSYSVHGQLKDSVTIAQPLASMTTITFTADKPISIKSTTTTDSSGNYRISGLKAPTTTSAAGSYNIEATFAEDSLYDPATSGKQALVVVKYGCTLLSNSFLGLVHEA